VAAAVRRDAIKGTLRPYVTQGVGLHYVIDRGEQRHTEVSSFGLWRQNLCREDET
jgi:hypothetical protein